MTPSQPPSTPSRTGYLPVFLKLLPKNIVYLKAVLESYDEIGILRTLNKDTGEVVILAVSDLKSELDDLLEGISAELEFTIQESPLNWDEMNDKMGDWLVDS